jgi:glycerol-3-phosphate dehydrogenase (NAD(P)+)
MSNILIIGDGGWGTALALLLEKNNKAKVKIWSAFPENAENFNKHRENTLFLPGVKIPETIRFITEPEKAVDEIDLAVFAVPSRFLSQVLPKFSKIIPHNAGLVSVIKGFDPQYETRISETITREFTHHSVAVLSGPSHAEEVARGVPTAVVLASSDNSFARKMQTLFSTATFRIYTSSDVCGVELGGALKNIIAIAAGISDGLGFGDNTKAALLTRGLAEIIRLGVALDAEQSTFSGLSGIGDLVVTCTSRWSRNRSLGERIGKGENIKQIFSSTKQVAEGATTCLTARKIARKFSIPLPITEEVYSVIYENKKPMDAVSALLNRELKPEREQLERKK